MWNLCFLFLFCISYTFFVAENDAQSQSSYRKPMIIYPTGVRITIDNERYLSLCVDNMACNLVHKRFWFSPLVERLCQCAYKSECSQEWSERDENTMFINPRAQLKFCSSVTDLPECAEKKLALTTRLHRYPDLERHVIEVKCYCPKFHYLKTTDYNISIGNKTTSVTQTYVCQKLQDCDTGDFCGHITGNFYQTYYKCTCPQHHLCLIGQDKNKYKIREALYEGDAYRGVCVQW